MKVFSKGRILEWMLLATLIVSNVVQFTNYQSLKDKVDGLTSMGSQKNTTTGAIPVDLDVDVIIMRGQVEEICENIQQGQDPSMAEAGFQRSQERYRETVTELKVSNKLGSYPEEPPTMKQLAQELEKRYDKYAGCSAKL